MKKYILYAITTLLLLAEIFCIKGIPVLKETFPLEKFEAVLFTLSQNIDGSMDFTISLIFEVFKHSVVFFGIIILAIVIILGFIKFLRNKKIIKFQKFPTYLQLISAANVIAFTSLIYAIFTQLPIINYYLIWEDINALPEHSEFYQKEYINPDSAKIIFNKKQNLILIFLESMEYNYQDSANGGNLPINLIPEITDYIKNEQSFIPGGSPAFGMGWTMADAVAKTCGIPLTFPSSITNQFTPLESFLPGVTCLTDILQNNGYNFTLVQGSNIKFSGMEQFLNSHSKPQIFDLTNLSKKTHITKKEHHKWGIRDSLIYEQAKETIHQLSSQEKPWALWLFTIDTHAPFGFADPNCKLPPNTPEANQYPYVIQCASRQLHQFIKWSETQKWFKNTTIAVMGDHATAASPTAVGFRDTTLTHYWLDFFINSSKKEVKRNRTFTSIDIFPTLLESIGADIPDGALGLGRSLYSLNPTLLEKYGRDSLDKALKKRSLEYNYFLYGKK